jgi:AcrR family transcriptional regulator
MTSTGRNTRRARNSISRDEIVAAATTLVQSSGLAALSMRRVAEQLGASTMSVYNHLRDRDELLLAMLDRALAELPYESDLADPLTRLGARMIGVHDYLAERTWIPRILVRGDLVAPSSFGFADACIADFSRLGLSATDSLFAFSACWHQMLGELLDRHPGDLGARPTQREQALRAMDTARYPHYAHVLDNLDPMDSPPADRFADDIDLLLIGIDARRTRPDPV